MNTSLPTITARRLTLVLACLVSFCIFPVAAQESREAKGLKEIPEHELGLMRGRYTVGNNRVLWFGVTMITTWQTQNGQAVQGNLNIGMDFRNGRPQITFTPNVHITDANAPLQLAAGNRSIDSSGLNNVTGMVQSVQIAGDDNRTANNMRVLVREGDAPASMGDASSGVEHAANGAASASASNGGRGIRLLVGVNGFGSAEQWIRPGSVGQSIRLTGDGHVVSNQLQMELVKQSLPISASLNQSVAQAIALNRGIGNSL